MARQISQGRKWYAIHTHSGFEEIVAKNLKQRIDAFGLHNKIFEVLIPLEPKIKIKGGKRKVVYEKIFPGYVLVNMIMTDETWYIVRNTPNVTGFIGSGIYPSPIPDEDVEKLKEKMKQEVPKFTVKLEKGDAVRIIEGPFKGFEGKISEVDKTKGKVKVLIVMFGRETPVELDFLQVKKL